jgi:hypothetical protein
MRLLSTTLSAIMIFLNACQNPDSKTIQTDFTALGDSLVKQTFDTLSSTLQKQIAAGGFDSAVGYCYLKAAYLTAIHSDEVTSVKRAALKVRNKENRADNMEEAQIRYFQNLIDQGLPLKSKLVAEHTGKVHYFKPIIIQPLCLGCHGNPEKEINSPTLSAIDKYYPSDEATGYAAGDLRGVWHLTFEPFEKKKKK